MAVGDVGVPLSDADITWLRKLIRSAINGAMAEQTQSAMHVDIYDRVVQSTLPDVIAESPIMMWNERTQKKHVFVFDNIHYGVPSIVEPTTGLLRTIDTASCRIRHADYACPVYARVTYRMGISEAYPRQKTALLGTRQVRRWLNVPMFWIPVMVGSSLCRERDINQIDIRRGGSAGCFIIEGKEKHFRIKTSTRCNTPLIKIVEKDGSGVPIYVRLQYRGSHIRQVRTSSTLYVHVRSPVPHVAVASAVPKLTFQVQFVEGTLNLGQIFSLLGYHSPSELEKAICGSGDAADDSFQRSDRLRAVVSRIIAECRDDLRRTPAETVSVISSPDREVSSSTRNAPASIVVTAQAEPVEGDTAEAADEGDAPAPSAYATSSEVAQRLILNEILPNVPPEHRVRTLAGLVRQALGVYHGMRPGDSQDSICNMRVETGARFMEMILYRFKTFSKLLSQKLKLRSQREEQELVGRFPELLAAHSNFLTAGVARSISTGNFGERAGDANSARNNMTQDVVRYNIRTLSSALGRIHKHVYSKAKQTAPRQLQFGGICKVETPEGDNCGLVTSLAALARLRTAVPSVDLLRAVKDVLQLGEDGLAPGAPPPPSLWSNNSGCPLVVNGAHVGYVTHGRAAVTRLRRGRIRGRLSAEASVALLFHDHNACGELRVTCDIGAIAAPLLETSQIPHILARRHVFDGLSPLDQWNQLVAGGSIMFITAEEQLMDPQTLTAPDLESLGQHAYDWCELMAGVTLLGHNAGKIPSSHTNMAPRNTIFASNMAPQTIGSLAMNSASRFDTQNFGLFYPQRSLVTTSTCAPSGEDEFPCYQSYVTVIMQKGSTMEDAVTINRASAERGLGRAWKTQSVFVTLEDETAMFGAPSSTGTSNLRAASYEKINPLTGAPDPGTVIEGGRDVLVGRFVDAESGHSAAKRKKIARQQDRRPCGARDMSVASRTTMLTAVVDDCVVGCDALGRGFTALRMRRDQPLREGDKLTTRHAQKGVIGRLENATDMPFTASGITPDMIVNCSRMPSRMTAGDITEMVHGKVAALAGRRIDATAFEPPRFDDNAARGQKDADHSAFAQTLVDHGLDWHGGEVLYCGKTGEVLGRNVMVGITTVVRLRHIIDDKGQVRREGPRSATTGQPLEGRINNGGLRFGEMENDAMKAHGASAVINDRTRLCSDGCHIPVCAGCNALLLEETGVLCERCVAEGREMDESTVTGDAAVTHVTSAITSILSQAGISTRFFGQ